MRHCLTRIKTTIWRGFIKMGHLWARDVVSLEALSGKFSSAVELRSEMINPRRFSFRGNVRA